MVLTDGEGSSTGSSSDVREAVGDVAISASFTDAVSGLRLVAPTVEGMRGVLQLH